MIKDRALSPHFTLYEFLRSQAAERVPHLRTLQYSPPPEVVSGLERLVEITLEPLRVEIDIPIIVTSGYRHREVNKKVGGATNSQHILGQAADLEIRSKIQAYLPSQVSPNGQLFSALAHDLEYYEVDQLIHEYGTPGRPAWVHVSHGSRNRREILRVWVGRDGKKRSERLTLKGVKKLCGVE